MEDRIEFDSVITEKALNDFKMYHIFHNVGGVFGYVFAAFASNSFAQMVLNAPVSSKPRSIPPTPANKLIIL